MVEYFVVGTNFELAQNRLTTSDLENPFPCCFVITRDGVFYGYMRAHLVNTHCEMRLQAEKPLSDHEQGELYGLFARICVRLANYKTSLVVQPSISVSTQLERMLSDDGFEFGSDGLWKRPPRPFVLPSNVKGTTMRDVYNDPLYIPWNFVPREWDVLARVVKAGLNIQFEGNNRPVRILDLGCGFGKNAIRLEALGFETFGLDIAPQAIERCRRLVKHPDRFVVGLATSLPWPDLMFDRVIDIGCIHCLPLESVVEAVKEIARVLAPRGILYSRIFKPRPESWLQAQPFKTTNFGYLEEEVLSFFAPYLEIIEVESGEDMIYVTCQKAGAI